MACEENNPEKEIQKLRIQMGQIQTAMEELNRAKAQTELKLNDELKRAQTFHKWRVTRIDKSTSQTMNLLQHLSMMYDQMFCLHENCELNEKSEDVVDRYKHEFGGLVNLYEKLAAGFLKPPRPRYVCPCQMSGEEYNQYVADETNGNSSERTSIALQQQSLYETYPYQKCACPTVNDESEEEEENNEEEEN